MAIKKSCVCGFLCLREEVKEQLERKKKGSRAMAEFEEKMNDVGFCDAVFLALISLFPTPLQPPLELFTHMFPGSSTEMEEGAGQEPREATGRPREGEEGCRQGEGTLPLVGHGVEDRTGQRQGEKVVGGEKGEERGTPVNQYLF